jgi:diacylglycerol kinase family enzyme
VIGTSAALGILPIGTLNHFARDLHIPFDLERSVATIAARHIGRVDVGEVNDHVFINNASIGIYPSIVDVRDELRRQGLHKWAMALAMSESCVDTWEMRMTSRSTAARSSADAVVFVGNNNTPSRAFA